MLEPPTFSTEGSSTTWTGDVGSFVLAPPIVSSKGGDSPLKFVFVSSYCGVMSNTLSSISIVSIYIGPTRSGGVALFVTFPSAAKSSSSSLVGSIAACSSPTN